MLNKTLQKNNSFLILIFLSIIFSSGIISQIINASSYYPSTVLALFLLLILFFLNISTFRINKLYLFLIFIFFIYNLIVINYSTVLFGNYGIEKSLITFLIFSIILCLIPLLKYILNIEKVVLIKNITEFFLVLFIFFGYLSYYFQKIGFLIGKQMIVYREPSHFALVLIPMLLFISKTTNNKVIKYLYLLLVLLLAILVENLTLLLGIVFISFIVFKNIRIFIVFISILFIIFFYIINIDLEYFTSRLFLNYEDQKASLSVLVFLSGWKRAYLSLLESNFLGLGFNRFGYVGSMDEYMHRIMQLMETGEPLNLYDGGTTASKLIAELGIFGIVLLIVYLIGFFQILSKFKKIKNDTTFFMLNTFYSSYYLGYSFELFVRGVGYFSPNLILFLASCYYLFFTQKNII